MKRAKRPKISLVRGGFANWFELQNYEPLKSTFDLQIITSYHSLTPIKLPSIKLLSPYDLPQFPYKQAILNRLIGDQHWLWQLEKYLLNSDIVHVAETYYAYTHQAIQLKKAGKIKTLISTCWETIPFNNETIPRKHRWKQEAYKFIDHFITPTQKAKQALIREGVSPTKISLIRVGVDLNRFTPLKKNFIQQQSSITVTYVGRNVPEKGVFDLKQAATKLPSFIKVNLIHNLPYNRIHKIYQQTDIFVLPSHQTPTWEEQYGMVLVEAMATGLPIITTKTGAIPEIVGSAAILIPPNNPQLLAKTIIKLATTPQLRQQLSQQAYKRAQRYFNRQDIAKQLANLYNKFI